MRSDRTSSADGSGGRSMSVIHTPRGGDDHRLPFLPRPDDCESASMTVPADAPSDASAWASSIVEPTTSNNSTRGTFARSASSADVRPSYLSAGRASATAREVDREHCGAEQHAVQRERSVGMPAHVPEQYRDREPAADRRCGDANEKRQTHSPFSNHVRHLQYHGGSDDRHAQQKTERRGAVSIQTKST